MSASGMRNIKIASLNCQGLGDFRKRRDVLHFLREKQFSIYCLQDTHFEKKIESYVTSEWGYKAYFSSYKSNSRGVAVLFNNNFEFKVSKVERDSNGNYLIISFTAMEQELLLICIYGPNTDSPLFYTQLTDKIKQYNNPNIIAVGDWNLVMDPALDYDNYKHINNPQAKKAVEDMTVELSLTDIWRETNPESKRYTWRRPNPIQQSRLDFFLISDHLYTYFENTEILPGYRTDHSILTLHLSFGKQMHRRTFWKFNYSLLQDENYVKIVKTEIQTVIGEYANQELPENCTYNGDIELKISDKVFLDFLLMKIRDKTIKFAIDKKKETKTMEDTLAKEIELLDKIPNKKETDLLELNKKKQDLCSLREKIMNGVLLRSKARWIDNGEKVTKYFCSLEKRNYVSKQIRKLVKTNGEETEQPQEIQEEVYGFYKDLYKTNENIIDCGISELINEIPQLSTEEKESLEGELTLEEAEYALQNMKNDKSPGSDGFSAEFFKFFWKELGFFVVRALNEAYRDGELSATQKEGLITCIPKGDKPREYVKNWRPISMLNVIYKIGSSCIANRIKNILSTLINEDQTGFIKNRYIGDNIRLIYDLIDYLNVKNLPGMLLCLDFEKAFDSLDWTFMFKALKAVGFGDSICQWIKTFYKDIKSTILVNGQYTKWFNIERGCRQGDPISPYLFVICAEILAIMIREEKDIKGININNIEYKISQFADDAQLMNKGDKTSFEKSIEIINKFSSVSGLFMNTGKTQVIWLGSLKHSKVRYMPHLKFEWNPKQFKILGIWFTQDLIECATINYTEKLSEVERLFRIWVKRNITPLGRIAILKSLILSKLVYLWMLLPNPPDNVISRLQLICYQFVWKKKNDKINRKTATKDVGNGGLVIPDLNMQIRALKLSWIRRLGNTDHKWKNICVQLHPHLNNLEKYGPCFINFKKKQNLFWLHTFKAYKLFYDKVHIKTEQEVLAEPVLFNEKFKIGGNVITNTKLVDKNVWYVAHFLKENGSFLRYEEFIRKYDMNLDFISYAGYVSMLKNFFAKMKITITDINPLQMPLALKIIFSIQKGTKLYYNTMTYDENVPKCCVKWENKLQSTICWRKVFLQIQKIKDIKLKWLQIRIVHRILASNIVWKEMKIVENDLCTFCKMHKDSIDHFMWKCQHIQSFWKDLQGLLKEKCQSCTCLHINEKLVLFGVDYGMKTDTVFDLIMLSAKMFIYKCKLNNTQPLLNIFMNEMKYRYRIEMYIAKINNCYNKVMTNWFPYSNIFCATDLT